ERVKLAADACERVAAGGKIVDLVEPLAALDVAPTRDVGVLEGPQRPWFARDALAPAVHARRETVDREIRHGLRPRHANDGPRIHARARRTASHRVRLAACLPEATKFCVEPRQVKRAAPD